MATGLQSQRRKTGDCKTRPSFLRTQESRRTKSGEETQGQQAPAVIPAHAGIQAYNVRGRSPAPAPLPVIPAHAGIQAYQVRERNPGPASPRRHSCARRNPGVQRPGKKPGHSPPRRHSCARRNPGVQRPGKKPGTSPPCPSFLRTQESSLPGPEKKARQQQSHHVQDPRHYVNAALTPRYRIITSVAWATSTARRLRHRRKRAAHSNPSQTAIQCR